MEFIKINRLRGNVADFTLSDTGIRVSFAGKQSKNPPIDLTEEQCHRFVNELTEALEVLYNDAESATEPGQQDSDDHVNEEL